MNCNLSSSAYELHQERMKCTFHFAICAAHMSCTEEKSPWSICKSNVSNGFSKDVNG